MNKLLVLFFCIVYGNVLAQEAMQVQRCADIDRRVPINNIFIDGNNNKWVADKEGLFLAQSPEFAKTVDIATGKWSLLSAPDGNMELNLDKENLQRLMGNSFTNISTAHITPSKKELWIGTAGCTSMLPENFMRAQMMACSPRKAVKSPCIAKVLT